MSIAKKKDIGAFEIIGKYEAPSAFGGRDYGAHDYGAGDVLQGIYRRRPGPEKTTIVKNKLYWPDNRKLPEQMRWRHYFADVVAEWKELSDEKKKYYEDLEYPKNVPGRNRYIRSCLLNPFAANCPPMPSKTPTIFNIEMASADQEYSQLLPANTLKVDIKLRATNAELRVAFVENESGTNFIKIPRGSSFHLEDTNLENITIYFQSPTASQVCEILAWT